MPDLTVALNNAIIHVLQTGLLDEVASRFRHPYIGKRGRITYTAYGREPTVSEGVIVFVGQDHDEYEEGPGPIPCVTLRTDDGAHVTRHIDYLTLLDD